MTKYELQEAKALLREIGLRFLQFNLLIAPPFIMAASSSTQEVAVISQDSILEPIPQAEVISVPANSANRFRFSAPGGLTYGTAGNFRFEPLFEQEVLNEFGDANSDQQCDEFSCSPAGQHGGSTCQSLDLADFKVAANNDLQAETPTQPVVPPSTPTTPPATPTTPAPGTGLPIVDSPGRAASRRRDLQDDLRLLRSQERSRSVASGPGLSNDSLNTIDQSVRLARLADRQEDRKRRRDVVDSALSRRRAISRAATRDQQTVANFYNDIDVNSLELSLERAVTNLDQTVVALESKPKGLEQGEASRFRNIFANALDKATAGLGILRQEQEEARLQRTPFGDLLNPLPGNGVARTEGLRELFTGGEDNLETNAATNDALVDRVLQFNGLNPRDQRRARNQINFIERKTLVLANGKKEEVDLLHNGYIFGAGETGIDCSSFVSSVLPENVARGPFNTMEYLLMWMYRKTGRLRANPPKMSTARAAVLKKTAEAFVPINVYEGQLPQPGDILVIRIPQMTSGHVYLVEEYDKKRHIAKVIDASQSKGTIVRREFHMLIKLYDDKPKYIRPGIVVLRLRPEGNKNSCNYRKVASNAKRKKR